MLLVQNRTCTFLVITLFDVSLSFSSGLFLYTIIRNHFLIHASSRCFELTCLPFHSEFPSLTSPSSNFPFSFPFCLSVAFLSDSVVVAGTTTLTLLLAILTLERLPNMSSPSPLNYWPCYSDIPIILDAQDEHRTPLIVDSSDRSLHIPHTTPNGRPLQFIRVASPMGSGNPCFRVSVPETAYQTPRNQPRRPTLRSFLPNESRQLSKALDPSPQEPHWGRQPNIRNRTRRERSAAIVQCSLAGSQVPFLGASVQNKTVQIDPESGCKTAFGLGIVNNPFDPTPSAIRLASHQRNESAPDIAQRIEERLW